jgi:hypothetical protein
MAISPFTENNVQSGPEQGRSIEQVANARVAGNPEVIRAWAAKLAQYREWGSGSVFKLKQCRGCQQSQLIS